jgi:hypothetical protein
VAGLDTVLELFADNVVAELNAFVTDKDGRASDQFANFVLGFAAKRTVQELTVFVLVAGVIAHT